MRIVSKSVEPEIQAIVSGEALMRRSAFNDMMQSVMPFGRVGCIPKGVYRFKTHEVS